MGPGEATAAPAGRKHNTNQKPPTTPTAGQDRGEPGNRLSSLSVLVSTCTIKLYHLRHGAALLCLPGGHVALGPALRSRTAPLNRRGGARKRLLWESEDGGQLPLHSGPEESRNKRCQ